MEDEEEEKNEEDEDDSLEREEEEEEEEEDKEDNISEDDAKTSNALPLKFILFIINLKKKNVIYSKYIYLLFSKKQ